MGRQRWIGWLSGVAGIALLAGCSAGPSGGGAAGTTVTITKVGSVPWLAVQDGSGSWTAVTGSSFVVNDADGRYGVAWECAQSSGQALIGVTQETTADATTVVASCLFDQASSTYSVSGNVTGVPAGGSAFVAIGNSFSTVTSASPSYSYPQVNGGLQTLVAYGLTSSSSPDTMVVQRGLSIVGNGTHDIDLTTGQPFSMTAFSVAGVPVGESPSAAAALVPDGSGFVLLAYDSSAASLSFPQLPAALAASGDLYYLDGGAAVSSGNVTLRQEVGLTSQSPSSGSLQLPAALDSSAAFSVSSGTATAAWGSVPFLAGGGVGALYGDFSPNALTSPTWVVMVTPAWLGSGATTYSFPDLTSTSGWNSAWNFPTGQSGYATVAALHVSTAFSLDQLVGLATGRASSITALSNGATYLISLRIESGVF